jgi:hypothetical protein
MTGGEIIAAKAFTAAAEAGAKALNDDDSKAQLQRLAEDTPEMKLAATQYAKRIAVKETIILRLYRPLGRLFGISRDYFDTDFATDMAEKTADIPEEDMVTPKASVAGPAIQGLTYTLDEPNLKEMYLNLLKTATDGRRPGAAHPSFAEIIRQISTEEASLLLTCLGAGPITIARIKAMVLARVNEYNVLRSTLISFAIEGEPDEAPMTPVYVDNWVRLGLVSVTFTEQLTVHAGATTVDPYAWVEDHPVYLRLMEQHDRPGEQQVAYDRGVMRATDFGLRFREAVS